MSKRATLQGVDGPSLAPHVHGQIGSLDYNLTLH